MRIVYHHSSYISHRLAALAYIDCLRGLGHELSLSLADAANADVVILHDEPPALPFLFDTFPALRTVRTVAYCVWESDVLPDEYAKALALVDEVWTPSEFSARAFASRCARVGVVPHVVTRGKALSADKARLRQLLAQAAGFRFYSIADAVNPRKNVPNLLSFFVAVRNSLDIPVSLVLKVYRRAWPGPRPEGVLFVEDDLGQGEMAALHQECHAYVSAHHAEGWGLGLSEAMACGRPVIATGWSGNMDFMDADNSVPVGYRLTAVSEAMCRALPLFTPAMHWAEPSPMAFIHAMRCAALGRLPASLPQKAATICQRFGPAAVASRLQALLENKGA